MEVALFRGDKRYTTLSTHHLQPVPTSILHSPHITYNQFQPVYYTVHTSSTTSSNQYTTPSTHHLHTVATGIPHFLHITYNQFQPVYHTECCFSRKRMEVALFRGDKRTDRHDEASNSFSQIPFCRNTQDLCVEWLYVIATNSCPIYCNAF